MSFHRPENLFLLNRLYTYLTTPLSCLDFRFHGGIVYRHWDSESRIEDQNGPLPDHKGGLLSRRFGVYGSRLIERSSDGRSVQCTVQYKDTCQGLHFLLLLDVWRMTRRGDSKEVVYNNVRIHVTVHWVRTFRKFAGSSPKSFLRSSSSYTSNSEV